MIYGKHDRAAPDPAINLDSSPVCRPKIDWKESTVTIAADARPIGHVGACDVAATGQVAACWTRRPAL